MSVRKHRPVVALVAALMLLLGACGDPTATTAPAANTTAPVASGATTAPAANTTAPAAGGGTTAASTGATTAPTANTTAPAASGSFDGTILFGAAISLTGTQAQEGIFTREGYELWKDQVNAAGGIKVGGKSYKIETKYYDDTSDAKQSATLATKLIKEDKVQFLLGPYGTAATAQQSTVAEQNKIPMVEGNGAAESIFKQGYTYTFGVLSPAKNYLVGVIDMALTQSPAPKTVAILTADDAFSVEVADAAKKYAEGKGLTTAYYQKYPNGSTNVKSLMTDAKGKSPDLVLNSGHLQESLAIVQAAKELGFNAQGFGFSVGPSLPSFQTTLKDDANAVLGGSQWTADLKYTGDDVFKTPANYNTLYTQKYNHAPSYQSASGSACGIAFQKALEAAGTLDAKAVRDALAKLDVKSFYGQIKFDERGINTFKPMAVEQWQDGKKVTVFPADVANAKPIWPHPAWK